MEKNQESGSSPDSAFQPEAVPGDPRSRDRKNPRRAGTARRRPPSPRSLIETKGPSPDAAIAQVRLVIGKIAGPHGVDGELKLRVVSDHPEHIPQLTEVYLGERDTPVKLLGARQHGDLMLIRLEGVTTPEEGKLLGGLVVRAPATALHPLEPGEYFLFQLIGLEARTPGGEPLGTVTDLIETGANDVLVIARPDAGDLLVPNHPEFVREISPGKTLIVIEPPVYDN
ncbi:MAG TPA: ribosome maturation factor RimM [Thermomicrobiales bacterium]|nr:ribosome maturation factor RimM [Thermomicrobiales bacterium]